MNSRVYVFIDASNLWESQKAKGKTFDYFKLKEYLIKHFNASEIKVFYYTAYPEEGTRNHSTKGRQKFFVFLKKGAGFEVIKKPLKRIIERKENLDFIKEKGNMDVEITIGAMHNINNYDKAIFFTGDSDFLALVTYLKNTDKKVYIYSSKNNISHELKTGGDGYCDILNIEEDIWLRDLKHRQSDN